MGKWLVILTTCVAAIVAPAVGIGLASTERSAAPSSDDIHVVVGPGSRVQFFDFDRDGLGFGDRLASVGPLLNEGQTTRVGTAYLDCLIVSRVLDGGKFDCTYVLELKDGDITTQGIDPRGPSDVLFAITGGTGAYRGAEGQARHIDTDVTDIIIDLDD
jgi:hypothetical protein